MSGRLIPWNTRLDAAAEDQIEEMSKALFKWVCDYHKEKGWENLNAFYISDSVGRLWAATAGLLGDQQRDELLKRFASIALMAEPGTDWMRKPNPGDVPQ